MLRHAYRSLFYLLALPLPSAHVLLEFIYAYRKHLPDPRDCQRTSVGTEAQGAQKFEEQCGITLFSETVSFALQKRLRFALQGIQTVQQ